MKQSRMSVEVTEVTLATMQDCVDLLEWSRTQDGLCVAIVGRVDGTLEVQAEGFTVPTVYAHMGDTVRWDGYRFHVDEAAE